ncbi:MAG TPA: cytochrome P450 [Candidatus Acidoferrum sp.]|nr:cytochrome P450 [Candidatus Acidoferrum sp.]
MIDDTEELRSLADGFLGDPERRRRWRAFYDLAYAAPAAELGGGRWLLVGHEDVVSVMKDEFAVPTALYPVTSSPELNELFLGLLPYETGADHRRLRSLTQSLFSAHTMSRLQQHILALLEELLYPAVFESEGCDVSETLGVRVPHVVSCLLLDVSPSDWDAIGHWSTTMYKQIGRYDQSKDEIRDSETAYKELSEYVRRRSKEESGTRCGGVGEALIGAWRAGDLDDKELLSYFTLFLLTGRDTLTYAIGNSVWFLGNESEVFSALQKDPGLAGIAFSEAMRLWGPIRLCVRQLQRPVSLSAGVLPRGSIVFFLIHAANRDPRRIEQPDEFLWNRHVSDDLAFGVGAHGCLGTAVGKMIGGTLYRTLAERCTSLQASPGKDDPQFIPSLPILGIQSVRLFGEPAQRNWLR